MPSQQPFERGDALIGRRFLALIVDWFIASLLAALLFGTGYPPDGPRQGFIVQGVFIVVVGLQVGLFGVSVGKRLVRLAVVNRQGAPIGWWRGLLRTALLSLVVPALIQTKDDRGLHDLAAGSKVVLVPKGG